MSIRDEIAALRAQIEARARATAPAGEPFPGLAPQGNGQPESGAPEVETLLEEVNALLDDFSDELDKYPKLTALAALGVGVALGVIISRQFR